MHFAGTTASSSRKMTLSASLDAVSTTGTVTSATVTVAVPGGNSGVFTFSGYVDTGTIGNTQYSRNGGAFTTIADPGDTVAFSNGDTLAVRTLLVGAGESRAFNVIDKSTGVVLDNVSHAYG